MNRESPRLPRKGREAGKILSVVVTGPWRVFKNNILCEPIYYNLPVACADQLEKYKESNLARVYLKTLLTQEIKGAKMAPPFTGATVGDSYYIRPSVLK